eukprot:TRINITY_DN1006_c1_g2_i1.p1 TRINITY_DN1006_c1_g2~~TRINITY_DN1006_c1_g2_i1.p1  ORF type:complete len:595 (+),score=268.47 TRINITY_DN1006_c1_g2_i1:57-1841(+)
MVKSNIHGDWFFFSEIEKDNVRDYVDHYGNDRGYGTNSFIDALLYPLMLRVANHVPDRVAPNVLTFAGLVTLGHAAYIAHNYSDTFPVFTAVACSLLASAYYILDAIDGLHARRIRNMSNIGSFMVHCINTAAPVFLTVVTCRAVLGVQSLATLWYAVQAVQLFFVFVHVRHEHGTSRRIVQYFLPGPASAVPLMPVIMLVKAVLHQTTGEPFTNIYNMWMAFVDLVIPYLAAFPAFQGGVREELLKNQMGQQVVHLSEKFQYFWQEETANRYHNSFLTLYVLGLCFVIVGCMYKPQSLPPAPSANSATPRSQCLGGEEKKEKKPTSRKPDEDAYERQTLNRLLICVLYRTLPGVMLNIGIVSPGDMTISKILVDGIFFSVLMSDLMLAYMARRALHPWIIVFSMVSIMDEYVEAVLCVFYFSSVMYDLSEHMQMPLFTVQRNVYVDGIYDLTHIGHMRMFQASAAFGNALFAGVVNDEDATPYKRKPIMTHEERCQAVAACRYVSRVIPNAPCDGLPKEFIEEHNIHLVVCGEEYYNNPNDKYYKVPREMGILQKAPRTDGISTSELIRRIQEIPSDDLAAKDKLRGESAVKI